MHINKKMKVGQLMEFPHVDRQSGLVSIGDSEAVTKADNKIEFPYAQKSEWAANKIRRTAPQNTSPGKGHRNYVWLKYKLGEVSSELAQGMDVLSGKFSGCYMIKYKLPGGLWRVAHVDTAGEGGPAAIADWNQMLQDPNVVIGCGFKPFQAQFANDFGEMTCTYGIITSDNKCYSVVAKNSAVFDGPNGIATEIRLIRKVTTRKSLPVGNLRVLTLING